MSHIENPETTTLRFLENWALSTPNSNRLIAELVSVSKETNREPDNYHYNVENGLLIDPETGRPVLDFIKPGVDYDIAKDLQSWAAVTEEGSAWWISPKLGNVYPCNKIIIHQIAHKPDGAKVALNSAILFDGDLENPEALRKTLFTGADTNETFVGIFSWLETQSIKEVGQSSTKNQAVHFAEQIKVGINPNLIIEEMRDSGFLGQNPISCASNQSLGAFTESHASIYIFSGAKDKYGSLTFKCPKISCGRINKRPYGQLLSRCQHCGGDVRC